MLFMFICYSKLFKIEQFYAYIFDNLDEMDQYFERHNLPKLMQEETHNLNRPVSIN